MVFKGNRRVSNTFAELHTKRARLAKKTMQVAPTIHARMRRESQSASSDMQPIYFSGEKQLAANARAYRLNAANREPDNGST